MRRASAVLLLALFSFSLISPAVSASDADSKLPACCRRHGKHHCTTPAKGSQSTSGPTVQAGKCPFFPVSEAVPKYRMIAGAAISLAEFEQLVIHQACIRPTESLRHGFHSRAHQKRGPPSFVA
jgi:hypothetical protein